MKSTVDLQKLNPLQRIILMYNGTLTKLLETIICEQLIVVKVHERIENNLEFFNALEVSSDQQVIHRKVFLQGQTSGINWIHAESFIVLNRLPSLFRDELLESNTPIGKLWSKHRVETYKELRQPFEESADQLAVHFGISTDDLLLGRTYRVFSQQQPIMILTEKFPSHYYTDLVSNVPIQIKTADKLKDE